MGRDESNRVVINHPRVSRLHARIEMRKDKFILVDQSTNGTHVHRLDGRGVLLRRDEIELTGEGVISLGQASDADSPHTIRYQAV
jgi:pSer/pThr/pTyr-binding forkhead associated (FHA) protein